MRRLMLWTLVCAAVTALHASSSSEEDTLTDALDLVLDELINNNVPLFNEEGNDSGDLKEIGTSLATDPSEKIETSLATDPSEKIETSLATDPSEKTETSLATDPTDATKICEPDCRENEECVEKECKCVTGYAKNEAGKCVDATKICKPTCGENEECEDNVCKCVTGYAQNGAGKCVECNCGEHGNCTIETGKKVCLCKANYKHNEKDGVCEVCDCKGLGNCSFINGEKFCECIKGYDYNYRTELCEECDCGANGTCRIRSGRKVCSCHATYAVKNGKCEKCDCGEKGKCNFDNKGEKVCGCEPGYKQNDKSKMCEECDCGKNGKCSFLKGVIKCDCDKGFKEHNNKCKECDCGKGTCTIDKEGKKNCTCDEGTAQRDEGGLCIETCDQSKKDDCKHGSSCEPKDGSGFSFCKCVTGLKGDKCDIITACVEGDFQNCASSGGNCIFLNSNVACICETSKKWDGSQKLCRKTCTKNGECKNGGECIADLCSCKPGTTGDDCGTVTGCDNTKIAECKNAKATCIYDSKNAKATCKCDDESYGYNEATKQCLAKWCGKNVCDPAISDCQVENGIGFCSCKDKTKYYDYSNKKCQVIDLCLTLKCREYEVCKDGTCACLDGYTNKTGECKPDICSSRPCFKNSICKESKFPGTVKCTCDPPNYYNALTGVCEDGTCMYEKDSKNCESKCPEHMKREKGECVPEKDENKCSSSKQCGHHGWCFKDGDNEICKCDPEFGQHIIVGFSDTTPETKCVLKVGKMCPKEKAAEIDSNKCDCQGAYMYAKDGVTCQKKSCDDEEIQKICTDGGASCEDYWTDKNRGYKCICPVGYEFQNGTCIDLCSAGGTTKCAETNQLCIVDEKKQAICRCPPGFTLNNDKCEPNDQPAAYLLENLPVYSKKYIKSVDKTVYKVELNRDIMQSMKNTFQNVEYAYLKSYRLTGDGVMLCNVALQVGKDAVDKDAVGNKDAGSEISRWKIQKREVSGVNFDLLPPSLQLDKNKKYQNDVKIQNITFCSACGPNTLCNEKTAGCVCKKGFRSVWPIHKFGKKVLQICEDTNECDEGAYSCPPNSDCTNTEGDYYCKCRKGYKKRWLGTTDGLDKEPCTELCSPNPCKHGKCDVKESNIECSCHPGFTGSICDRPDPHFAKARRNLTVVAAVLGTLLAVTVILFLIYIRRQKKKCYSEDFTTSPRLEQAEMAESRPMRGISNRAYQ